MVLLKAAKLNHIDNRALELYQSSMIVAQLKNNFADAAFPVKYQKWLNIVHTKKSTICTYSYKSQTTDRCD